jgi:hypothetical protein
MVAVQASHTKRAVRLGRAGRRLADIPEITCTELMNAVSTIGS